MLHEIHESEVLELLEVVRHGSKEVVSYSARGVPKYRYKRMAQHLKRLAELGEVVGPMWREFSKLRYPHAGTLAPSEFWLKVERVAQNIEKLGNGDRDEERLHACHDHCRSLLVVTARELDRRKMLQAPMPAEKT